MSDVLGETYLKLVNGEYHPFAKYSDNYVDKIEDKKNIILGKRLIWTLLK